MKITLLLSSLHLSGGVSALVEYANRLTQRGHSITIVAPGHSRSPEISSSINPRIEICERSYLPEKFQVMPHNLRLAWEMAQAIPNSDFIISTHTPTTFVNLLAKCVFHRHGIPIWFYMDYPGMFQGRPMESWLLRNALRWHSVGFTLSEYSKNELLGFSQGNIQVVGLGINYPDMFHQLSIPDHHPVNAIKSIFYLGDLRPRKGFQDFLQAVKQVYAQNQNIELWIALKDNGEFETPIPFKRYNRPSNTKIAELYSTCDVFVSASWYEGFGLPPLEAMACGAPVVLTDSGGVNEYARSGWNCVMVPKQQSALLAKGILSVMENNELSATLRMNGPITAARFSWEKATDRLEQTLNALKSN